MPTTLATVSNYVKRIKRKLKQGKYASPWQPIVVTIRILYHTIWCWPSASTEFMTTSYLWTKSSLLKIYNSLITKSREGYHMFSIFDTLTSNLIKVWWTCLLEIRGLVWDDELEDPYANNFFFFFTDFLHCEKKNPIADEPQLLHRLTIRDNNSIAFEENFQ